MISTVYQSNIEAIWTEHVSCYLCQCNLWDLSRVVKASSSRVKDCRVECVSQGIASDPKAEGCWRPMRIFPIGSLPDLFGCWMLRIVVTEQSAGWCDKLSGWQFQCGPRVKTIQHSIAKLKGTTVNQHLSKGQNQWDQWWEAGMKPCVYNESMSLTLNGLLFDGGQLAHIGIK